MYFERGKIYIVNDINSRKLIHMKSDVKDHFNTYAFLNFPYNDSLKVGYYYEKIKKRTIKMAKREISSIIGEDFELEDADYSEKVMVVSYLLLKENEVLAVRTIGMSLGSIECFKERFTKITDFLNKVLIVYSNR